jgi:hypothetical protein
LRCVVISTCTPRNTKKFPGVRAGKRMGIKEDERDTSIIGHAK